MIIVYGAAERLPAKGIDMHFRAYEYVITLAEEMNFSKAAKRLFISQPSLSQYINRIEEELGVQLFDRSSVPLVLTYEGELYVETARKIINMQRQLLNAFDDSKELKKGRLAIGLTPSKANHPLPVILPAFSRQYPDIELSVTESSSAELEELIEKGIIDICLINLPIASGGLTTEPIFTEKILLATPRGHSLAANGRAYVTPQEMKLLSREPFILLHPGQRLRQIANDIFTEAGFKPKILMETRNMETAVRLAASGVGFAFTPETLALGLRLPAPPEYLPVGEPPLTWTLGFAYKKDRYLHKAARAFADVARKVIQDLSVYSS